MDDLPILFLVDFLQDHTTGLHGILGCREEIVNGTAVERFV